MVATVVAIGQEPGTTICATNPPDFINLSYDAASDAVNSEAMAIAGSKWKKICPEYITNLAQDIQSKNLENDKKVLAVYLLGILQPTDTNAIQVLIENISLVATRYDKGFHGMRWGYYPAEEALERVGKPSFPLIFRHLLTETNEPNRRLMCEILVNVEGKEAAQNQIKQKIDSASDSATKANLELALKELEK